MERDSDALRCLQGDQLDAKLLKLKAALGSEAQIPACQVPIELVPHRAQLAGYQVSGPRPRPALVLIRSSTGSSTVWDRSSTGSAARRETTNHA